MFDQLKRLFKHSFIYALGSAMQSLVGFLLIPVYTRYLSPAEYGTLEILNTVLLILTMLFSFGFSSALLKVHERDCQNENDKKVMLGNVFGLIMPVTIVLLILMWFSSPFISQQFFGSSEQANLISIIYITVFFNIFSGLAFSMLRAKERSISYTTLYFIRFALTLILNIYFVVYLHLNVYGILIGNLIAHIIVSLAFIPAVVKYVKFKYNKFFLKKLFSFGLPIIPASLAMWIMDLSDRYYLEHFSNLTEVGLYSLGYKIGMVIYVLIVVPFQLAWSSLSYQVSNLKQVKDIYAKTLTYYLFGSCFIALLLSLFSGIIIKALSSPEYYSASGVVWLIAFSYVLYGIHFVVVIGLHLKEKTKYYPLLVIIPAVINLILNYFVVPAYGMTGAAFTTLLSFIIMAIMTYYVSQYYYKVNYEIGRIAKIFIVAFAILIFSFFLDLSNLSISSLLFIFVLLVSYPTLLYLLRFFKKGEINKAKEILSKINNKS